MSHSENPKSASDNASEHYPANPVSVSPVVEVDATGLTCPLPLLKAKQALNGVKPGDCVKVVATDAGSVRDFKVFADLSGNRMLEFNEQEGTYTYLLQKT